MKTNTFLALGLALCLFACKSETKKLDLNEEASEVIEEVITNEISELNVEFSGTDTKYSDENAQIVDIRKKFQNTENGLKSFIKKTAKIDIYDLKADLTGYYTKEGIPTKAIVEEMMGHGAMKTSYYTHDGYLYFVFEEEFSEASVNGPDTYKQKRMYFDGGKLIRVLTKEKTVHGGQQVKFSEVPNIDATSSLTNPQAEIKKYNNSVTEALRELARAKASTTSSVAFTNGRWISTEDSNSGIEIKGNEWIMIYKDGAKESRTPFNFTVSQKTTSGQTYDHLTLTKGNETMEYSVMNYTKDELKILYIDAGNILTYTPEVAASLPSLATFTKWPEEIEGCSCSFGKTLQDVYDRKYTYVDNFEETAMIKMNGKMIPFKLIKAEPFSENSIIKTFSSGKYILNFDVKKAGMSDSQTVYKGTVILSKDGSIIAKDNVHGSCGC